MLLGIGRRRRLCLGKVASLFPVLELVFDHAERGLDEQDVHSAGQCGVGDRCFEEEVCYPGYGDKDHCLVKRCRPGGERLQPSLPADERFSAISVGYFYVCALRLDGSPVCAGRGAAALSVPPEGETSTAVSAGFSHACGLRQDGFPRLLGFSTPGAGRSRLNIPAGRGEIHGHQQRLGSHLRPASGRLARLLDIL